MTPEDPSILHRILADVVLVAHCGVVVFVIGGLVVVWVGNWRGWMWVNRLWFRSVHLGLIVLVMVQGWFGRICPLTTLESALRVRAGRPGYDGGFIQYWVGRCLYYDAPLWMFGVAYTLFCTLVALTWWRFPPRSRAALRKARGNNRGNG